jgi:hypothetical protein
MTRRRKSDSTTRRTTPSPSSAVLLWSSWQVSGIDGAWAWNPSLRPKQLSPGPREITRPTSLSAKRNKNRREEDDLYRWYDDVGEDATPDKVFWEEMERQRLLNQVGGGEPTSSTNDGASPRQPVAVAGTAAPSPRNYNIPPPMSGFGGMYGSGGGGGLGSSNGSTSSSAGGTNGSTTASTATTNYFYNLEASKSPPMRRQPVPTMEQIKMADATLAQYELYQVSDNWLNEDLQKEMGAMKPTIFKADGDNEEDDDYSIPNGTTNTNVESQDYGEFGNVNNEVEVNGGETNAPEDQERMELLDLPENSRFLVDDEPWDIYGDRMSMKSEERQNVLEVPFPPKGTTRFHPCQPWHVT